MTKIYLRCHGRSPLIPIPRLRQAATIKFSFSFGMFWKGIVFIEEFIKKNMS